VELEHWVRYDVRTLNLQVHLFGGYADVSESGYRETDQGFTLNGDISDETFKLPEGKKEPSLQCMKSRKILHSLFLDTVVRHNFRRWRTSRNGGQDRG